MNEEKEQLLDEQEAPEEVLGGGAGFQSPALWFGLLLVPVIVGLGGAWVGGSEEIQAPEAVVEAPAEAGEGVGAEVPVAASRGPRAGTWDLETEDFQEEDVSCAFAYLVGRSLDREVQAFLETLERPVRFLEDLGQETVMREPARINVYVDPRKMITRVECG